MRDRKIFVAGSTGAVGRALARVAGDAADLVLHARRALPGAAAHVVFDLADRARLVSTLSACTTVVQLIGTMRKRFASGDTYETSDVGTTRLLADAAREAGIDHLVLLSSVGASHTGNAYLAAKASAEAIVQASGIEYTIFRPSILIGRGGPSAMDALLRSLAPLTGTLGRLRPIETETVARAILACARRRAPLDAVLEDAAIRRLSEERP